MKWLLALFKGYNNRSIKARMAVIIAIFLNYIGESLPKSMECILNSLTNIKIEDDLSYRQIEGLHHLTKNEENRRLLINNQIISALLPFCFNYWRAS